MHVTEKQQNLRVQEMLELREEESDAKDTVPNARDVKIGDSAKAAMARTRSRVRWTPDADAILCIMFSDLIRLKSATRSTISNVLLCEPNVAEQLRQVLDIPQEKLQDCIRARLRTIIRTL
jgi:hypothetical protein